MNKSLENCGVMTNIVHAKKQAIDINGFQITHSPPLSMRSRGRGFGSLNCCSASIQEHSNKQHPIKKSPNVPEPLQML